MPNLPLVGATATLDGFDVFSKEIAQMQADILAVGEATKKASKPIQEFGFNLGTITGIAKGIGSNLKAMSTQTQGVGASSGDAGRGVGVLDIALGNLVGTIATRALDAVGGLVDKLGFSEGSFTRVAARADELRLVAQYMGATVGESATQVDDQITAIQKAGIQYDVAATTVSKFAENNLDLSKSVDLVRIAQASAIKMGTNSSEALNNIIYGITALQPRVLRTAGIMVGLEEAEAAFADEAGTTTKAMTQQEKQQAMLNMVLEKGAALQGLYAAAMLEPEKRLGSLERITYEISRTIGQNFKPAFSAYVDILETADKAMLAAVSDGGAFHDLLMNLGAASGLFGDALASGFKTGLDNLMSFTEGMSTTLGGAADDALAWGINIVTELADGIIQGAAGALTAAMDFIGGILSSFLSPGSPPKVAPDIDAWGAAAMDAYLQGFTEADYSILEGVQGPLQNMLDLVGQSGDYSKLSLDLAQAIQQYNLTGQMQTNIFEQLAAVGGVYGKELEKLARLEFGLADATRDTTQATQAYEAAQQNVEQLTEEYNALADAEQAAGETPGPVKFLGGYTKDKYRVTALGATVGGSAALDAKKAELDEAKRKAALLKQEQDAAKLREQAVKTQITLQKNLIEQLVKQAELQERLAKAQEAANKAVAGKAQAKTAAKAAGAGKVSPAAGGVSLQIPKIGPLINEELDKAKAGISAKLGELFAPLKQRWEESMKPALDELGKKFEEFKGIVTQAFDAIKLAVQPVVDELVKLIPPDLLKTIGEIIGVAAVGGAGILGAQFALGLAATAAGALGTALLALAANPVVLAAAGLVLVSKALTDYGTAILGADAATATFYQKLEVGIWGTLNTAATTVATMGKIIELKFWEFMNNAQLAANGKLAEIKLFLENTLSEAGVTVRTMGLIIEYEFWNFLNNASIWATNLLTEIKTTISTKLAEAAAKWKEITDGIAKGWQEFWAGLHTKFTELWNKIQDSLTTAKNFLLNTFIDPVKKALDGLAEGIMYVIGLFEELIKKARNAMGLTDRATKPTNPPAEPSTNVQGGYPGYQFGGTIPDTGTYILHKREAVLTAGMRAGRQAIPPAYLSQAALARMQAAPVPVRGGGLASTVNSRSIVVEVNPTYRTVESPASIYYDVLSALSAARA